MAGLGAVRRLHEESSVRRLTNRIDCAIAKFALDVLVVDTHPGLNDETLLTIALSDVLAIVLRSSLFDAPASKERVEQMDEGDVLALMPHSDEIMMLASGSIVVRQAS